MTSKQALNRIKNISIYKDMDPTNPCSDYIEYQGSLKNCYKEEINTIEKDLEVLDLLKPIICETIDLSNHGIPNNALLYGIRDNKLLKEWLENDQ